MALRFFIVPVRDSAAAEQELNRFRRNQMGQTWRNQMGQWRNQMGQTSLFVIVPKRGLTHLISVVIWKSFTESKPKEMEYWMVTMVLKLT